MGFKTISFTEKVERRTYIQGNFIGKYNGSLIKDQSAGSISKVYDIHIYEGKISNVINHVENPDIINEKKYESITSHLLLEQKSFENVECITDNRIDKYDGFKLYIKEPKLENVQIKDVLKEGNRTFGTLTCKVSGYLIDYILEEDSIEIEICDDCSRPLEDCICKNKVSSPVVIPNSEETNTLPWYKWDMDYTRSGCLTAVGITLLLFFLLALGLPGIILLIIIVVLYSIGNLSATANLFGKLFSWLGYVLLGLFALGIFFVLIDKCLDDRPSSNSNYPELNTPRENTHQDPVHEAPIRKPVIQKREVETQNRIQKTLPSTIKSRSVYICNGKYANRYHLSPYCRGLSNCKSTVSSISLKDAQNSGRSLCGWEN